MNYGQVVNTEDPAGKIDDKAVNGLAGVEDSLAYKVAEIERHFHSYEHFFETAATPSGEAHTADGVGSGSGPFTVDAGNNTWGAWVQLLGSSDTPHIAGNVKFDFHELFIEAAEKTGTYFIQVGFGASGAAALSANTVSELVYVGTIGLGNPSPLELKAERQDAGTKVWVRCKSPGVNTAELDLYFGIHEYEG